MHPKVAGRSCDSCAKYMYDDTPDELSDRISLLVDGDKWERGGAATPCHMCPKVPHDKQKNGATRADAIEPTEESWSILWHYRQCKEVMRFPVDALVERHAGIIGNVERSIDLMLAQQSHGLMGLLTEFVMATRRT